MVAPMIAAAGAASAAASGILRPLFGLVDELFTSDEERAEAKRKLVEMEQKGQLAQIAVNMQEAKHESPYVAGWRPFIGWVCGLAFAYNFILRDFIVLGVKLFAPDFPINELPVLDIGPMLTVLLGMLGLGSLRTFEKYTGTNVNRGGIVKAPDARRPAFG